MEREEYAQLLASRRRAGARRLDETRASRSPREAPRPTALGRVIAKAVRGVRRRTAAAAAWERVAPSSLVTLVRVASVRGEVIELEAAGPSVRFEFERQRAKYERALCRAVSGATRVVLLIADGLNRAAEGAEESA